MSYAILERTIDLIPTGIYGYIRNGRYNTMRYAQTMAEKLHDLEGGSFVVVSVDE